MARTKQERELLDSYIYDPEWKVYAKRADFQAIGERFGISQFLARIIRNRDVVGDESIDMYLYGDITAAHDPALLKDVDKAAEIILSKLKVGKKIRIISDYDVDGVTSNYILLKGMQRVYRHITGEEDCPLVSYDIPHRIHDGYGINIRLIDKAIADGVDTIITCDNGIAAINQTAYAKGKGLTMIITDHHEVPYELSEDGEKQYILPEADAIIDHKQQDCPYPFKEICGAGVAYKFIQYLYRIAGIAEEEVQDFLEVLGIATVCDIMDLADENRIFVKYALHRVSNSSNVGLKALMDLSGRTGKKLTSYDFGFLVGPCINAAGRLGDAKTSLEFLLEESAEEAVVKAAELLEVNKQRKAMTDSGVKQIKEMLEDATLRGSFGVEPTLADKIIVAYIPEVHESVVGIMASKLKEAYNRPVMVFTDSETPGILKGSGRSIEAYNMYEELSKVKKLFTAFGGHAMAAGFSIKEENFDELRTSLNELTTLTPEDMIPKLMIDIALPLAYNSFELTNEINLLEPYGKGNRKCIFAQSGISVRGAQIMGANKNTIKLFLDMGDGKTIEGMFFDAQFFIECIKMWFGETECAKMINGRPSRVCLDIAYYPNINEYRDSRTLQVMIEKFRKHEA